MDGTADDETIAKKPQPFEAQQGYFVAYPDGSRTPVMSKAHAVQLAPNFQGVVQYQGGAASESSGGTPRPASRGPLSAGRTLRALAGILTSIVRPRRGK